MSTATQCEICLQKKAQHSCELCEKSVCKNCKEDLDSFTFSFLTKVPAELSKSLYCLHCYDSVVGPARQEYDDKLKQAEEIYFLTKAYPGYVRVLKRHTKRVEILDCDDRRETILRMAFMAVELGFNAIIEADVKSHKARKGGYQTSRWVGSAMPANVDAAQLERASLKRI